MKEELQCSCLVVGMMVVFQCKLGSLGKSNHQYHECVFQSSNSQLELLGRLGVVGKHHHNVGNQCKFDPCSQR